MNLDKILSGIVLTFFMISCDGEKQEGTDDLKSQIEILKKENERLRSSSSAKETSVTEYQRTLEEIDYNLRLIELNLMQVSTGSGRETPVKQRIDNRLSVIQKLIQNSNLKIKDLDGNLDDLRKKTKNRSSEVLALERVMKNAAKVLINKEEELNQLIDELQITGENAEKTYEEQLAITFELYKIVNRAYFLKGTKDELASLGVLDSEGNYIGLAQVKFLNTSLADSIFLQLEKDKKGSFVFDEDRIKMISLHAENSYTLKRAPSKNVLTIKDRKAFWKNGNYLIIQTN